MGCCLNSHRHEVIAQRTRVGRGNLVPELSALEPRVDMMEETKQVKAGHGHNSGTQAFNWGQVRIGKANGRQGSVFS